MDPDDSVADSVGADSGASGNSKQKNDTGVDEVLPHLYLSNRFRASSKHIIEAVSTMVRPFCNVLEHNYYY